MEIFDELHSDESDKAQVPDGLLLSIPKVICLSCRFLINDNTFCSVTSIEVKDSEKEIECSSFKKKQCRGCGFLENGICVAFDGSTSKFPDDECDYDMRNFM
jgi:hypothetical protein